MASQLKIHQSLGVLSTKGQLEDPDAVMSGYEQSLRVGAATTCCKFTKGVTPDFIFYAYVLDALDKLDSKKAGGGEDFIMREAKVIARLLATADAHIATADEAAASMGGGNIDFAARLEMISDEEAFGQQTAEAAQRRARKDQLAKALAAATALLSTPKNCVRSRLVTNKQTKTRYIDVNNIA